MLNPPTDRALWHTEITGGAFDVPVGAGLMIQV